jgi:hypothetical protein
MANDKRVALLNKGVAAWNEWRAKNPWIEADLSGEHLMWANLAGVDLSSARQISERRTSTQLNSAGRT